MSTSDRTTAIEAIFRPRTVSLLGTSIALALVVGVGALVLGIAAAAAATRLHLPGGRWWRLALCAPLAVPSFVAAFAWTSAAPGVHGFWALAPLLVLSTFPYVAVPAMAAFATADHSLADVARTLGRSRRTVFMTITLPQILPAATAGALLVVLYALSDFGAPAYLRVETLTTGIYAQFTGGFDRTRAAAMALVLAVVAIACVALERWARGRHTELPARAQAAAPRTPSTAVRITGATGLVALFGLSVVFPLGALCVRMLLSDRYTSTASDLGGALATTISIALIGAALTLLVALPVSWLAARYRGRLAATIESLSYIGHALPGVVVALALVALSLGVLPGLYQSVALLVAAYVILFLPKTIGSSRAAFARVPRVGEEVARTLGTGAFLSWWRVVLPPALPGIVAGGVLVAIAIMRELPATLMLRPIGFDTLATELWSKTSIGAYGAAAPAGLLLIVAGLVPAWLLASSLERHIDVRTDVKTGET